METAEEYFNRTGYRVKTCEELREILCKRWRRDDVPYDLRAGYCEVRGMYVVREVLRKYLPRKCGICGKKPQGLRKHHFCYSTNCRLVNDVPFVYFLRSDRGEIKV